MDIQALHETILYPVVRVRASDKGGASGVLIYSEPDPEKQGQFLTFVLTNEHVIEPAVKIKKEFDSLVRRQVEKDILAPVMVETFEYVGLSKVDTTKAYRGHIIAYDKTEDIAVLQLESPRQQPYVAKILPMDKIDDIKLFSPVWTCGCSLLHEPFANPGFVTFLQEIIENKLYGMTNANSIFGNSGGAVFLADPPRLIGLTARITGLQLGFGVDIITWMGFFVHPKRLYEFFDRQELRFLYDPQDTYAAAMQRREVRRKEALFALREELLAGEGKEGEKKP